MKKLIAFTSAAAASLAIYAAPQVSDVTLTQDASKTVTITYKLKNEPGIVTVDIQTNAGEKGWVSIGGQYLTYFKGDANKLVQPSATETRTITWKPRKAWPDNAVTENVKAVISAWATNAPPDYMAVSLLGTKEVFYYTCKENVPFGVSNDLYKTEMMLMRKIPAANVQWRMGSPTTETGRKTDEVARLVTLDEDYYIGVYEVTQRQYELIRSGVKPSYNNNVDDYATRPVEQVAYTAIRGTGKLWPADGHEVDNNNVINSLRSLTGVSGFELPTDAQWEFACRAGCGAALYDGKELENDSGTSANLARLARYVKNGGKTADNQRWPKDCTAEHGTAKVGSYEPNAWGLYDMLGNASEWCLDWWASKPTSEEVEAGGPTTGTHRVYREPSYVVDATACRCARRMAKDPAYNNYDAGFRLACIIPR